MSETIRLQKHAKGMRPQFFSDPAMDKLLSMVMALAGEVAVIKDRNDTLERLVDEKNLIARDEIEAYRPSKEVMTERDAWREEFLSQILRIVDLDPDQSGRNDLSEGWQSIIDDMGK